MILATLMTGQARVLIEVVAGEGPLEVSRNSAALPRHMLRLGHPVQRENHDKPCKPSRVLSESK